MLKRIDHINIVVRDLNRAKDFFIALGFKVRDQSDLSGEWISSIVGLPGVQASYVALELPGAECALELIEYSNPVGVALDETGYPNTIGLRHLAFEVQDIEAVVAKLKALDARMVGDISVYPKTGKKLVYFYGPDQILLELAQYSQT